MKQLLPGILILFLISSCDSHQDEAYIPSKPSSVPESALWVGGLDGGVFVIVKKIKTDPPGEYRGEVYYVSGDTAYKGKMKLTPENSSGFNYLNPASFEGWDGDTLYIAGGRQLKIYK